MGLILSCLQHWDKSPLSNFCRLLLVDAHCRLNDVSNVFVKCIMHVSLSTVHFRCFAHFARCHDNVHGHLLGCNEYR
jgi:hypothetical protein